MNTKVLLIIEGTYPWYRGGVSEWVFQYLNALPEIEFDIIQIATDEFSGLKLEKALYPVTNNVKSFQRVPPPKQLTHWTKDSEDWFSEIENDVVTLAESHEIIHVTNTGFAGWLGYKLSKLFSKKLILTEHALYWKEVEMGAVALECGYKVPDTDEGKGIVVQTFIDIAKLVYEASEEVISVSKCNLKEQRLLGAKSNYCIPNGIPNSWITQNKHRSETPTIGWVGRCAEMKNPLRFFDLVDEFRKSEFSSNYLMLLSDAGENELWDEVLLKAQNYPEVKLVLNESAADYFPKMDMILISSHNESQPLVMFEALSQKALPVGWEVGDLTNEFGFVLPNSSSAIELCVAITELWTDKVRFESFVEERFELLTKNHTWTAIFDQYRKVIEKQIELVDCDE